jgi:hypothetical protein
MSLSVLLQSKHDSIVERWLHAVVATYPSGSSNHLLNQKDRFNNPVGDVLRRGLPVLFSALADTVAGDDPTGAIGDIMRIRTVQCEKPSKAVAWVFALKEIARSELGTAGELADLAADWKEFDSRIDGLALTMCDEFLACKEVIGEIRVREAQMRSAKLIEQVNKLYGGVEESRDSDVDNKSNAGNL